MGPVWRAWTTFCRLALQGPSGNNGSVMAKETCLDNEFITIWYHADKGIVHHEWHKFMQGKSLRQALLTGTELLKKNKGTKWLSDDRNYPLLTSEDSLWVDAIWFPKTVKAGWKHWAIVMPHKPVGQINLNQIVKRIAAAGINAQMFTDLDEAMKWLEEQK
jgi:hypothetical protein